jgi:CRISPR-associated protein Cas2
MSLGWIVAYDVSRDRDRERVATRLLTRGVRLQRSVYEVTASDARPLLAELAGLVRVEHDVIQAFRQCGACAGALVSVGPCGPTMRQRWWVA